jgi:hypothetical protein
VAGLFRGHERADDAVVIDDDGVHAVHGVAGILALEVGEAGVEAIVEEADHHAGVVAACL